MHKSQGFGSEKSRGSQFEYFKHMKGAEAKDDLFDGVDMTWNRYSETKSLKKMIDQTINNYEYKPHDNFLSELMELYHAFQKISKNNKELAAQKHLKIALLERIILASSGVWADVTTSLQTIAPGQDVKVNISLIKSSKEPISVLNLKTFNNDTSLNLSLTDNKMERISQTVKVPLNTKQSTPYWLTTFPEKGLFQVHDLKQNTLAENATAATASILFKVMNDTFSTTIPIRYKTVDPVKGEQYQPLQIVPPIAINVSYNNYLFTNDKTKTIPVTIVSSTDSIKGVVSVNAPQGWDVKISNADFQLVGKGSQTIIPIAITPSKNATDGNMNLSVNANGKIYNQSLTIIDYDHIPKQLLLQPAATHLIHEDIKIPAIKIGYIPGAGDEVAELLKELGMDVTIINDEQLVSASFDKYDAIITGVRAYNTNDKLQSLHAKMMRYVEQGGNLIVQYNTNSRVGPLKTKIGPYPFTITRDRVTDETAPVEILQSSHAAFNSPNKIASKDFEGWHQERGIYFASEIDAHYQPLLRMNDPGEKPNDGSLIVAPYGKGNFVYTGLVFFRELPAGVSGAYKLLLNLVALPKNK